MYNWNKYTVIHNEIIVKKSVVKMNHFILALQFMTSVEWKQSQNIAVFQPCLSVMWLLISILISCTVILFF